MKVNELIEKLQAFPDRPILTANTKFWHRLSLIRPSANGIDTYDVKEINNIIDKNMPILIKNYS